LDGQLIERRREFKMAGSNSFLCFSLGLGVGIAAGLLLAPQEGAETRSMLAEKATGTGDYLKTKAREGSDFVAEKTEQGKAYVRDAAKNAGDLVDQAKSKVQNASAQAAGQTSAG
jgi:gas vesicle protein